MILVGICHADDSMPCPVCGASVPLPAESCPSCDAQFFLIRRKRKMCRDDAEFIDPAQAMRAI